MRLLINRHCLYFAHSHPRRDVHDRDIAVNVPVPEVDDRLPVHTRHVPEAENLEVLQVADAPDAQTVHDRLCLLRRDPDTAHLARESFLLLWGRHVKDVKISPVLNTLVRFHVSISLYSSNILSKSFTCDVSVPIYPHTLS